LCGNQAEKKLHRLQRQETGPEVGVHKSTRNDPRFVNEAKTGPKRKKENKGRKKNLVPGTQKTGVGEGYEENRLAERANKEIGVRFGEGPE